MQPVSQLIFQPTNQPIQTTNQPTEQARKQAIKQAASKQKQTNKQTNKQTRYIHILCVYMFTCSVFVQSFDQVYIELWLRLSTPILHFTTYAREIREKSRWLQGQVVLSTWLHNFLIFFFRVDLDCISIFYVIMFTDNLRIVKVKNIFK